MLVFEMKPFSEFRQGQEVLVFGRTPRLERAVSGVPVPLRRTVLKSFSGALP